MCLRTRCDNTNSQHRHIQGHKVTAEKERFFNEILIYRIFLIIREFNPHAPNRFPLLR